MMRGLKYLGPGLETHATPAAMGCPNLDLQVSPGPKWWGASSVRGWALMVHYVLTWYIARTSVEL